MKIPTSDLIGVALDQKVAECLGLDYFEPDIGPPNYSTDWSLGGDIIEQEKITLEWTGENWMAYIVHDEEFFAGTPLVAAMRSFVGYQLGDEVNVPDAIDNR